MRKILHLITGLGIGGSEFMLYRLLSRMNSRCFEPVVASLRDKGPLGERISGLGISVHALGLKCWQFTPLAMARLMGIVSRFKPALIQGWMYHGNLAALLAGWECPRTPVLWNIRQSLDAFREEKFATSAIIRLGAWLSRYPQKIIYNARCSAVQHEALGYSPPRRVIIPNGFDVEGFRPSEEARLDVRQELKIPSCDVIIGLVARYHPVKDHENFLKAAARLLPTYPDAHFVLIGKGVDPRNKTLAQWIAWLSLAHKVHLLGERDDIARLTAALDIATSASYAEGLSNTIGEAMSCGVPCVATDAGDNPELIADTGVVVPQRDPAAMALAWAHILRMGHEGRQALGKKARERILKYYSLESAVACYESLYNSLL